MNITFEKVILNDCVTTAVKRKDQLRLYKVHNREHEIAGQFYFYHKTCFMVFGDQEIMVNELRESRKKTRHVLIDKKTNEQVGEYKLGYSTKGAMGYPLSKSVIHLADKRYTFNRTSTGISTNWFKRETLGHFRFEMYQDYGDEFAEFALKIDAPDWQPTNNTKYLNFLGAINTNITDTYTILSAFYLFEMEFDHEDAKYD